MASKKEKIRTNPKRVKPMKIFISYSTKDKELVRAVTKLMPFEVDPWIDHRAIGGGSFLSSKIKKGIKEADIFFVFISQDAINSKWVPNEIKWALEKEKNLKYNFIVPVVLDEKAWNGWKKNKLVDKKYIDYNPEESHYLLANELKNSIVDKTIEKYEHQCLFKKKIVENVLGSILVVLLSIGFFTQPTESEHVENLLSKSTQCNSSEIRFDDMWFFSHATCPISQDKKLLSFGAFDMMFTRENQIR